MNRSAALATFLAVGVALIAYFFMRLVPRTEPPHKLYYDSVITTISGGKEKNDTVWSKVPDFEFTNQLGQKVSWKDMQGKVVVADFFFTSCPVICPEMTVNMRELQRSIKTTKKVGQKDTSFVQFLSFTVDPEKDSVSELKKYADRFQIDPENWWLLTGNKKEIYDLALNGMKLGITEKIVDTAFIHPQKFMLIDKDRVVRARKDSMGNFRIYNGRDSSDVKALAEDIILLSLEKDSRKKFFLADKLELIAVVFVIMAIGLLVMLRFLKKEKRTK
jgi:protein SCO1